MSSQIPALNHINCSVGWWILTSFRQSKASRFVPLTLNYTFHIQESALVRSGQSAKFHQTVSARVHADIHVSPQTLVKGKFILQCINYTCTLGSGLQVQQEELPSCQCPQWTIIRDLHFQAIKLTSYSFIFSGWT